MSKMSKMKKPKSLRPPMPIVTPTTNLSSNDSNAQFELELCWCIQQLENSLNSGKLSHKVAEDTIKNLKILKGCSTPLIKKRQVMKASMGDYRAKMKEEEKRMSLAVKQIKFTPTADANKKSSFVKKSAILTSGKDFKFNFKTPTEDINLYNGDQKEVQQEAVTSADSFSTNNFLLTSGNGFKFNFVIDEVNNEIDFDQLTIKN